ncbi:MAG: alpha/beta hydrolase [bacterium]
MHLPLVIVRGGLFLQRAGLGGRMPLPLARRYLDRLGAGLPAPAGTTSRWTMLGGRRTLVVSPSGDFSADRAILYFHGGGYTVGTPAAYRSTAGFLARASGAPVYLPDYRLAPEDPFPAARDDALAAYAELTEPTRRRLVGPSGDGSASDGASTERRVVLAGDSAGGGLAVVAARNALDAGLRAPVGLALLSPWVDVGERIGEPSVAGVPVRDRDRIVRASWGDFNARSYTAGVDAADPDISPINAELAGLPPMLIHVGTEELLLGQVRHFAERAAAAGVDVELTEYDWMWHVAHLQAGLLGAAAEAADELGRFAGARLSPG